MGTETNAVGTTKRCAKCGETKALSEFHKDRSRPDGLYRRCRACARARDATYYAENGERKRSVVAAHYAANRMAVRARQTTYRRTPHGRAIHCLHSALRRHLQRAGEALLSVVELAAIKAIYADAAFRMELTGIIFHVDHRIAVALAKKDTTLAPVVCHPDNLEPLPRHLNLKKRTKSVEQFAAECDEYARWQSGVPEFEQHTVVLASGHRYDITFTND